MTKRTPEQWQALFEAHQQSGLSQAQFCKAQQLCPKYFSVRRRQWLSGEGQSPFVRVQRAKPVVTDVLPLEWQVQFGEVRVCILNASVEQMVGLLKGLA